MKDKRLAASHRRQFSGEDYQRVAIELVTKTNLVGEAAEEEYKRLCEAPDPGCDCGFCQTAEWES